MNAVKLMDGYDTVVDRTKLRVVVQGAHQKGALHLLNKLIPLVFTTEELASSCGKGLSSSSRPGAGGKIPLDATKVNVCKGGSC